MLTVGNSVLAYSFAESTGLNKTATPSGYDTTAANPEETLSQRVAQVISIIISFVGVLFLGLMIYGGYRWMMANGNDSEVVLAKKIITRALVGLVVVLAAYSITAFVANNLKGNLVQ